MDNLIFSLNATIPIFLLMVLGLLFRKIGWMDEEFASKMNRFVFKIPLPVLVFKNLATVDIAAAWDGGFVLFCFLVTVCSIAISTGLSFLWKDKEDRGEFIQSSYRSSAALLGIAFIQNLYGASTMGPLMIIGSVPLYNIFAVIVLSLTEVRTSEEHPSKKGLDSELMKETFWGILKNPILIGIVIGLIWSALRLPLSGIPAKAVDNLAAVATPMGLMAMGATFDFRKALGTKWPAMVAAFLKLIGFCGIFLPLAVMMGYRNEQLVAVLVMLGSATTVSCFVMAKNMGHRGILSSSVIMLTTLLSAFSLTFWLWLLRSLGLI